MAWQNRPQSRRIDRLDQCILISGFTPPPNAGILLSALPFGVCGVYAQELPVSIRVGSPQSKLLQFPISDIKVVPATPVKRRGKSMSRRTGQNGYIERSGKWWVVRWWMDVSGQEKRRHMRAKICPISGQGSLSKSARERRGSEIITASGADTVECFSQVVKQQHGVTFRQQAKWWLNHLRERRRKPIAASTLETWEACIDNWLNPNIGDLPLSEINNAVLKTVVAKMSEGGLSPKTITDNYAPVVKMVVASAVDEQGEEIYPRKWNAEFIDLPVVEKEKQNTPSFSTEMMTGLARWKKRRERMVFILSWCDWSSNRRDAWYRNREARLSRLLDHLRQTESSSRQGRTTAQDKERSSSG